MSTESWLLVLKVKSSETEKLSFALWELPGVLGIEESPTDGDSLFRPEAEFEILEFGSEAAEKCAEWMSRESYRPRGQMLLKIYLDSDPVQALGGLEAWLEKIPKKFFFEVLVQKTLDDTDYLQAYRDSVQGVALDHGLFVGPPWSAVDRKNADHFIVEPGLAFGTGDHPTTQLCLERIKEYSKARHWAKPFRALDLGAGSGLLGLALQRYFPFCDLLLADYDPLCADEIRKTFALNEHSLSHARILSGPQGSVEALQSQGLGGFDFIVSNIYAEVLAQNIKFIRQLLCPGGLWLLSGILGGEPETGLLKALEAENFQIQLRRERQREGAVWKDKGLESHRETWVLLEVV